MKIPQSPPSSQTGQPWRLQWTKAARAKIQSLEYRYISPLFTSSKSGNVGKILNAALVNMPAMDLAAIAAASRFSIDDDADEAVAAAINSGKLSASYREWALNYCRSDASGFEGFVTTLSPLNRPPAANTQNRSGNVADPSEIAASARTFVNEQAKLGRIVPFVQAVMYVTVLR